MNEGGIMGVVVFTSTADEKQSDGTQGEIMFIDEIRLVPFCVVLFVLFFFVNIIASCLGL